MKNKLCMLLLASGIGLFSCAEQNLPKEYTDSVNVFIGTGGHGHTFPGATLPHGMVQLSPDTRLFGWDACSGYYYDDTSIMGFTHTHLSGTGIGDYGDILFMPVVGEKPLIAGTAENPDEGYRSRFSHEQESARPGYYQVLLQDDSINVELTATLRAGLHRYTYPKASDARLIVDMEPTIHGHQHPVTQIRVVNDSTIAGMKYTVGWAKHHYVYFYAVFSSPFDYKLYSGTEYQSDSTSVTVNTAKAVMSFRNLPADGRVLAKVGISSVDEEGARLNVEAEIPNWDFESVMKQANTAWNEALGKIANGIFDTDYTRRFGTALLLGKRIFIAEEEVELYRYKDTAPAGYYSRLEENLKFLHNYFYLLYFDILHNLIQILKIPYFLEILLNYMDLQILFLIYLFL